MAVTTPISEERWARPDLTRDMPVKWFGCDVPNNVTAIEIRRNYLYDQLEVHWRVKGTVEVHTMPFEQTDEGVTAALAAMKLTC